MVFFGAVKDRVCEGLGGQAAAGAGVVGEVAPPGGVSREVAFASPHLVYSSGDKLVQAHKGVRGEFRRVEVVNGSGVKSFPVVQKGISCPPLESEVRP